MPVLYVIGYGTDERNFDVVLIECFVDGASRGQGVKEIGDAACAAVIYKNRKKIAFYSRALGKRDNNEAEYEAVLMGLLMCAMADYKNPIIYSDSAVVVNQVNGRWKCNNEKLLPLLMSIKVIQKEFYFKLVQVPREFVHPADTEAHKILNDLEAEKDKMKGKRKTKK